MRIEYQTNPSATQVRRASISVMVYVAILVASVIVLLVAALSYVTRPVEVIIGDPKGASWFTSLRIVDGVYAFEGRGAGGSYWGWGGIHAGFVAWVIIFAHLSWFAVRWSRGRSRLRRPADVNTQERHSGSETEIKALSRPSDSNSLHGERHGDSNRF